MRSKSPSPGTWSRYSEPTSRGRCGKLPELFCRLQHGRLGVGEMRTTEMEAGGRQSVPSIGLGHALSMFDGQVALRSSTSARGGIAYQRTSNRRPAPPLLRQHLISYDGKYSRASTRLGDTICVTRTARRVSSKLWQDGKVGEYLERFSGSCDLTCCVG